MFPSGAVTERAGSSDRCTGLAVRHGVLTLSPYGGLSPPRTRTTPGTVTLIGTVFILGVVRSRSWCPHRVMVGIRSPGRFCVRSSRSAIWYLRVPAPFPTGRWSAWASGPTASSRRLKVPFRQLHRALIGGVSASRPVFLDDPSVSRSDPHPAPPSRTVTADAQTVPVLPPGSRVVGLAYLMRFCWSLHLRAGRMTCGLVDSRPHLAV